MIRSFVPLDFVDLLAAGKALSNKAKMREDLGRKDARLGDLARIVGDWFNPRLRVYAWVYTEGLALKGMASVRVRYSSRSWEVNRLLVAEQDHRTCLNLLDHVSSVAWQAQIGRIFLRLPSDSPLLKPVQETGFLPYSTEHLLWRENAGATSAGNAGAMPPAGHAGATPAGNAGTTPAGNAGTTPAGNAALAAPSFRRKKADDDYRLFELYLKCVHPHVRRAEGMTYQEWQVNRRRSLGQEWVFEKDGGMVGWTATNLGRCCGLLEVLAANREDMEGVVDHGLAILSPCPQAFCPVPDSDGALLRLLEDRGFKRVMTHTMLMKELLVQVVEPYVMPAVPA